MRDTALSASRPLRCNVVADELLARTLAKYPFDPRRCAAIDMPLIESVETSVLMRALEVYELDWLDFANANTSRRRFDLMFVPCGQKPL